MTLNAQQQTEIKSNAVAEPENESCKRRPLTLQHYQGAFNVEQTSFFRSYVAISASSLHYDVK